MESTESTHVMQSIGRNALPRAMHWHAHARHHPNGGAQTRPPPDPPFFLTHAPRGSLVMMHVEACCANEYNEGVPSPRVRAHDGPGPPVRPITGVRTANKADGLDLLATRG